MTQATISQLEAELIEAVKGVPAFLQSGFSVFDLADMDEKRTAQTLPAFGVAYDGAEPVGNDAKPTDRSNRAVAMVSVQFVIVIATQYRYTGQDDTKQQAFALLDQVRGVLLGYQNANSRPWRFVGERPEPDASGDGVIFYTQVWQTSLPISGNFNSSL